MKRRSCTRTSFSFPLKATQNIVRNGLRRSGHSHLPIRCICSYTPPCSRRRYCCLCQLDSLDVYRTVDTSQRRPVDSDAFIVKMQEEIPDISFSIASPAQYTFFKYESLEKKKQEQQKHQSASRLIVLLSRSPTTLTTPSSHIPFTISANSAWSTGIVDWFSRDLIAPDHRRPVRPAASTKAKI